MVDPKDPRDDLLQQEEEGRHTHDPKESPATQGEGEISGSSPSPTSDDDTAQALEEVIGNEPEEGKPFSLAEEVKKDDPHNLPPEPGIPPELEKEENK